MYSFDCSYTLSKSGHFGAEPLHSWNRKRHVSETPQLPLSLSHTLLCTLYNLDPDSVYVFEVKGSGESGDGSATKPYKTIVQVPLKQVWYSAVVKHNVLHLLLLTCVQLDGVFLLYMMEHNANRREADNVLNEIYKEFAQRKKRERSQQPRPLALPR